MTPSKLLGLLLVIVYIVALKVLAVLDVHGVFEHPLLLPLLNTLFAGIVPVSVAYIASKTYLKSGSVTVLFMGCGMLSFGLCAISAGWLIQASDGANLNVTVYNVGAFLGSAFHAVGAILGLSSTIYPDESGARRLRILLAYLGITVFVFCLSLAALRGLVPPFFIQGVGPTGLRQAILGSAVLLYFASSVLLMTYYFGSRSDLLYWYSLCLAMIAIGLFAFFLQRSVGCPIGWLGRSANYLGGLFALVAILGALKNARVRGVSLERTIANGFQGGGTSHLIGVLAVVPLLVILTLSLLMVSLDIRTVFEPAGLFAALNTLFLSILPLTVVYFATKGYLRRGLLTMLMLGSGTLTLGLGSLSSGWLMILEHGGPNASATIFNVSLLLSAVFQLVGGLFVFIGVHSNRDTRHNNLIATLTYVGIAVLLGLLTNMTLQHRIPVFFIQGEGPTALRQTVLGTATILFAISGLLLMAAYLFSRARILYWYSLALLLFATGGISLVFAKSVGSPVTWLGRTGFYLAGIYLFVAVTSAARELRAKGESLETGITNFFRHHLEALVEERTLELSRAKEQLQAAHSELERSNAELQQFAYVASHDLQEPLRMISSYVKLLERRYKGKLDQDADDFIGYAVDGAKRMQQLINDLLQYSRAGTHTKPFESVDCEILLERALANLRTSIEDCHAQVTHDPLPVMMADGTQVTQLLQNLIGNALKFRKDERPLIRISAERSNGSWLFGVSDNGIGIAPQHADRIFIMFQRLHGRDEYPGTGIGLAICKKIVERHGGSIWVESEPGVGTTFYFRIPENRPPTTAVGSSISSQQGSNTGR